MTGSRPRHWGVDLPDDWRMGQMKHAGRITLGKMLQPEGESSEEALYLRAANVQPDGILALDDVKTMYFKSGELEQLALERGDVVVVEGGQGGYGRAAFIRNGLAGWGFQNSIMRLRPVRTDGRFLAYYLIAARGLGYVRAICNVVSMPHYTSEKLAATPVPLPPEIEQVAIADYLDHETAQIDALIGKQQQLIKTLHERRSTLISQTLLRYDSAWPVDKLGRRTTIGNGSTPRREQTNFWLDGEIPWLNSAVVNKSEVLSADQFVTLEALSQCHLSIVPPGSLLVGLTGQGRTRGMATLLRIPATVSQHVGFITPDPCWHPAYLLWSLKAQYQNLRSISDENGSTKGGLTCEDLKNVKLPRPPIDDQVCIANSLDKQSGSLDMLILKAEQFITLARERRSALITAAVTGQIDVRAAS